MSKLKIFSMKFKAIFGYDTQVKFSITPSPRQKNMNLF